MSWGYNNWQSDCDNSWQQADCYYPCQNNNSSTFVLIVVLFILLIIVGAVIWK